MKQFLLSTLLTFLLFYPGWTQEDTAPFITSWSTTADESITIGLDSDFTYEFSYVWKDVDSEVVSSGTHISDDGDFVTTLTETGTFSLEVTGDFPHFQDYPKTQLLDVTQWGDIVWGSFEASFDSWGGTDFSATDAPDLTLVTDMSNIFNETSFFNGDLSNWDVSNISIFHRAFREAEAFTGESISGWNTGNAIDMGFMFAAADNFNGDISSWEVGKVTNMNRLFNLATNFNADLSGWNVENVTDMLRMFRSTSFDQDISGWDVGKVTTMDEMFSGSSLSRTNYENLLMGWSAITDLQTNVDFDAGGNQACLAEAEIARSVLINEFGWNISDNGICDEATDILFFEIANEQFSETIIDYDSHTIAFQVFGSTDLSTLTPIFTLSEGAISDLASGETRDFSQSETTPVIYTITAEDGVTQQTWGVTITNTTTLFTETDFLSFQFSGLSSAGSNVDVDNHEISAFVPSGTSLTNLTPIFTLSRYANGDPLSGVTQDFTNSVTYTITAEDGTTVQPWIVTVTEFDPFITSWNISANDEITIPLNSSFTYDFSYVWKDADGLIVNSGSHTSDEGDFSTTFVNAGIYSLEIYNSFPHFQNYPKNQLLDVIQWGDIVWGSMLNAFNNWPGTGFSAEDTPDLTNATSMAQAFKDASNFNDDISDWDVSPITSFVETFENAFDFNQNLGAWVLNTTDNINCARMFERATGFEALGMDQWNVEHVTRFNDAFLGVPIASDTYNDIIISWSKQNLSSGVELGINLGEVCSTEAEYAREAIKSEFNWTFDDGGTCDEATNILHFDILDEQIGEAVIDTTNLTATVEVFSEADVTTLTPSIILSEGASSDPATGIVQDFTNAVTYTVTAEDEVTTQDWTVIVSFSEQLPFITSWSTVADESITIELDGSFDYNFNYSWKDIDGNEITAGRHTSDDGDFVTAFTESEEVTLEIKGNFPHFSDYPKAQLLDVQQWGEIQWGSMASSFENWPGTDFSATDSPDLSQVTNMSLMFREAANFDDDLNDWQVGHVTSMADLFLDAVSFNSNISDWDVSSVTNMRRMFFRSDAFNQDLSRWDVSEVRNMSEMFSGADNFTSDLSDWEVNGETVLNGMFRDVINFNSDLNDWDVSQVTNLSDLFENAQSFNGNISDWDVSNVSNMSGMFDNADAFNRDLSEWNVSNVTNMSFMFNDNGGFNGNIGTWNVGNVTDMEAMFDNADAFNRDLSEWNVSNVRDMSFMFQNNGGFNGNIGTWKVDSVTTMFRMFENAGAFNQDLNHWNTVSLTNMQRMFRNANSFNGDMSNWNVESVTNMAQIFNEADSFDQDLSAWNVSNAGTMTNIFENSGLSGQNYDKILIAWVALPDLNENISLGAEGVTFCKAAEAKTILTDPDGLNWTITDDGSFCLDETDILSFEFEEGFFDTEINATAHTIQTVVTFDADVTALSPFITLSPGATIAPDSEEVVDFIDPVEYTVTAEDGVTTEIWTVTVLSQPDNDFCTGAITVNVDDVVTGNTTLATNDSNIASDCGSNIVSGVSIGVWYRFVGNGETITLNTCTGDKYDFDDTSMSVYTGSCATGLSCLAGNEDAGIVDECGESGYQARLSFNSEIGTDYFILVDGYSNSIGEFDLSVTSEPTLPPPANDNCGEAETLTVFAEGTGTPAEGTNANATAFTGTVDCDEYATINDVWYTFNSGSNTEVIVEVALTDTDDDGELVAAGFINYELYDDCDGEGLDFCGGSGSTSIEVTPNTDYWLQLWNNSDNEGTFTIQINDGSNTAAELSFENAVTDAIDISRFTETGVQIDSVIADDDEDHAQLFSITAGNEEGIFAIDEASGALIVTDAALLSASATTSFSLTILSEDQGPGELFSEIILTVNVIDNAPPVVTDETIFIDENTANDTFVVTFQTSDPDGDLVFPDDASTDPEGILAVDEDGTISVLDESLLDFEVNPSIQVTLFVEDDGPLNLKAAGTIIVNLNDVNEAPVLADTAFSISSFSANGLLIGTIPFTDEDAGQTHTYAILDDGDNDGAIFSVDATTGELTVLDETQLSANGETTYTFDVEVTDDGEEPLSSTATVTINTFGNNPPVITAKTFTVNENTSNDSRVGILEAVDADDDDIAFSLESETSVFAVASDGEITVADSEALDFESNASFELLVGATDDGIGTLKSTQTIFITLNDINEAPEVTSATFEISSFSEDGSIVGQVEAEDQDGDVLSYEIASGNEDGIFAIDETTGLLSIVDASLLDPINIPQHVLTVEVSDGGLKANPEFTINVFLNTAPELTPISFSIDENNESSALIGTLEATDSDGIESLEITSGNDEGIFELNESTGELSLTSDVIFNFEETQSYLLGVTATDDGLGNVSTTEIVTISVNDINEFDPVISEVTGASIDENAEAGIVAATVVASDEDTFQTLAYSITSGNEEGIFAIDENGEITTLAAIDFEQNPSFSLSVEVSDDLEPVRTIDETVSINVNDVNETPVLEAMDAITSAAGSEITFTIVATDPEGAGLTYTFSEEGTAQDGMTIDEGTGDFSWTPTTDQLGSFDLTILVSDGVFDVSETVSFTILNNGTDILAFELEEQTGDATIDADNHTVDIEVTFGTDITELAPELTLSQGATSDPSDEVIVDFTNAVTYTITAENGDTQEWEVNVSVEPNNETDILSFALEEQTGNASIDTNDLTVDIEVAFGTDMTSLTPTLTLSEGATSDPESGTTVDFTNAVTYTVTAEDDATTQEWTVTVTEALNTATDILSFVLEEQTNEATINTDNHTVDIEVTFGSDMASLTPTLTLSEGATSDPESGVAQDFTNTITYTVTAEDGNTQEWAVTVSESDNTATDILTFALTEQTSDAFIDTDNHTVDIEVEFGTDVTALIPTLTLSEGAISDPASGATVDFTNAITYTVTAADGSTTQGWTVTVTLDEEEPDTDTDILTFVLTEQTGNAIIDTDNHTIDIEVAFGTDVSALTPTLTLSEGATSDPASNQETDFTNAVTYTITAEDGLTAQNWIVTVTLEEEALNTDTDILTFVLAEQTSNAIIDSENHTVIIAVAFGTNVIALTPAMTLSKGATGDPASGTTLDFTDAVTYTVTAEDGLTTQDWTINVSIDFNTATDILTFQLPEQTSNAILDTDNHQVEIEVVFGTDITELTPALTLSEGAISNPANGTTVDFTDAVTYAVTAEDGSTTQDWLVTVTVDGEEPDIDTDILTFLLEEQTGDASIDTDNHTVDIEVAFGTDVTALIPTLTLSEGAISDPTSGSEIDFTDAVTYTVTAEDGINIQEWVVTVTLEEEELNTATDLLTFVLAEQTSNAVIDTDNHTVVIAVALGTDISNLLPVLTLSAGASSVPTSATMVDFTNAVTYTVTAEDGITTQEWVVTVTLGEEEPNTDTDILTFVLGEQTSNALVDSDNHTVDVEVAFGTDLTALIPTFTLSEGATSDPASEESVDFTNAVIYTVTAEDGETTQEWIVTVTLDGEEPDTDTDILTFDLVEQTSSAIIDTNNHTVDIEVDFGTDVTALTPTLILSEGATSDPASGSTVDFTEAVTYTVIAEDGITIQEWVVNVTIHEEELNAATDILTFVLAEQTSNALIDTDNHTVVIEVVFGTDLSNLLPVLTLSAGASSDPTSATTVDFTNAVTYTVTAEDGETTQEWTITVTTEEEEENLSTETNILTFEISGQTGSSTINSTNHTIDIEVAFDTDITALAPTLILSEGATSDPDSGETLDFTDAVTYTVTAEDGETTQNWIVRVALEEENILGLEEAVELNFYPNPVDHILHIQTSKHVFISMTDSNGRSVLSEQSGSDLELDLSHLNQGMYFLMIRKENQVIRKKIIKNK